MNSLYISAQVVCTIEKAILTFDDDNSDITFLLFLLTEIDCGDPGEPENGRKNIRGSGTSAVVTYRCDIGYRLQGDTSRVCQTSGSWSGTVPTCNSELLKIYIFI